MLHGAGNAVQLPDELFELFRTAKVQVAVPQKTDGQHHQNRQADGQCREYDAEEQRVEGCEGLHQWRLQMQASRAGYRSAAAVTNESISGPAMKRSPLFFDWLDLALIWKKASRPEKAGRCPSRRGQRWLAAVMGNVEKCDIGYD